MPRRTSSWSSRRKIRIGTPPWCPIEPAIGGRTGLPALLAYFTRLRALDKAARPNEPLALGEQDAKTTTPFDSGHPTLALPGW
jgi:hypothetical protein